jgi:hypothetical protein
MQICRVNDFVAARGDDCRRLSVQSGKSFAASAALLQREARMRKKFSVERSSASSATFLACMANH